MVSPVRGNGPPLSARVGRSPVVPDGRTVFPPIRYLAGRVQSLRGRVLPGLKMRPAISLTVFVPKVANTASPAPASVASAMPAVMAWAVSCQGSELFWNISRQTRRPAPMTYTRMKMLIPRTTSPCVTLQGLRSFSGAGAVRCVSPCSPLWYLPARGGGEARDAKGCPIGRASRRYGRGSDGLPSACPWLLKTPLDRRYRRLGYGLARASQQQSVSSLLLFTRCARQVTAGYGRMSPRTAAGLH